MSAGEAGGLEVERLAVSFGRTQAVRDVSFTVAPGECVALVGESGSGKSVTARALLGLAGPGSSVAARRLSFDGHDLSALGEPEWRRLRGRRIGLVHQDAMTSLDPLRRVGREVAETLRIHTVVERSALNAEVGSLLSRAGLPSPEIKAQQYTFQLSGGQRQRALIAAALAGRPSLLIADEPTTALDVTVQRQVLDLFGELRDAGTAVLLISHDLAVVARLADRIAVLSEGAVVEYGPAVRVLREPDAQYTRDLLAAVPSTHAKGSRLSGAEPLGRTAAPEPRPGGPVLVVDRLGKSFLAPDGRYRPAVRDVSFTLSDGETLGVVGESGSGKTTTARMVLGLLKPDHGTVWLAGEPWSVGSERSRRPRRHVIQAVQQDPAGSFDPRFTIAGLLGEALPGGRAVRAARIRELMDLVRLPAALLRRRPAELSGGQRQRVAIARALACSPRVLLCDEPVSALDVSVQAQILDLLADLQAELGTAMLFISHDLGVVRHVSDRVAVMKDGQIIEAAAAESVFVNPQQPYTKELISALPSPDDVIARNVPDDEEETRT
ncbi:MULTISPECIES: dipeptide ABC transporter ATP-binding protein [Amycolatopsis]|uniref:dipeptide ABC transporter ATP-binding protein n=1 Tax=Amycolatopsis TaxID=1813 RepID=UPI000F79BFAF|nr:ABC transporter ATP-binding protein [Amycolatopsis sp. WAC 04197]RSN39545.1 ABC transporter ATP-binding protein [Amycolatopsis sp. WAC 04197]